MTVLQLQLTDKQSFILTTPAKASVNNVKLLEGVFAVKDNCLMLDGVELATVADGHLTLNTSVLTKVIGDIRQIVQQLRYFAKVLG